MWQWAVENSAVVQTLVSLLSTVVWIAYLHVFLSSYRRQTRSSLLISRTGQRGLEGRCIISNMGSEPAFLMDVLAEFRLEESSVTASVVERVDLWEREQDTSHGVSAAGPMESGSYVDIGSIHEILDRAHRRFGVADFASEIKSMTLIAVAATSQARELVAATRSYSFDPDRDADPGAGGETVEIRPVEIKAKQLRSRREQRRLARALAELQTDDKLDWAISTDLNRTSRGDLRAWWRGRHEAPLQK